ncbi:MAG: lysophospholipid acyltransferase family protein [Deltaproteobacteria bacterium]|nr:lysophospholipid acyltransferase family protein [Deltaproteobacteria bacterium]
MTLLLRLKGLFLRLLPKKVFYMLGYLLGYLWFYVLRIRRNEAIKNVCMVLGVDRDEGKRIVLQSMINIVISFLEFISQRKVKVAYKGLENWIQRLKGGAIVATAHTSNWDILERVACENSIKLGVLSRKTKFSPLQSLLEELRRSRNEVVFWEHTGIATLVRFLRSEGVLGVVIDQNMPPRHGRPAKFFNKMVNTTFTPQILSIRSGRPIIPVFIRRVELGSYEIIFYEPHILRDHSDEEIQNSMNYLNELLEKFIRENPSQWLWVHKRFKPLR